ncbi:alpha/beta-hydrolase [Stereum hirsutum FP-91666 SS1]|uniref:alpha/beta-hydrolase n=1 Tax=Stereum hirsutum (strain FP-91666) TaxID=721885 RepID=UPI000440FC6B|nr:alpha/beta-hydrolase [Stereum hirsutum FP-91666 SS1]EIM89554.1 alpha/beta-hydrolase [Stereum hirsutum FP-91666 SS1]
MVGIQNATTEPNECIQAGDGTSATNPFESRSLSKRATASEDCLFLNVHVPSNISSNASLPVIVWIHGGGYAAGSASDEAQDFVKETGFQVISVNPQYRLGLFGFLPGHEVKEGGALNAGLLDQQFALQWVQDHIASFGGDPTRVTIWGESAGAGSVLQHVVAHGGNTQPPLFRAAMMSSLFLPFQYEFNDTIPETLYSEVVDQSNCTDAVDRLACLRATDVSVLTAANTNLSDANFFGTFTFVPVIDGDFSIERPIATLNKTQLNGEVLLAVTNAFEGNLFVNQTMFNGTNITLTDYVTQLFSRLNAEQIQHTVDLYSNVSDLPDVVLQANAIMGENIFICPTYFSLQAFGNKSWKGEFAIPPATHGEDLSYYFGTSPTARTFNSTAFFSAFSDSFFNTALFLNASQKIDNSTITPPWATWSEGHTEMLFNQTEGLPSEPVVEAIVTDDGLLGRCEWWRTLAPINAQ